MELLQKHPLTAKYTSLFSKFGITTNLRLAHFIGQAMHESGLKPKAENLNYSVDGLLGTFGRHRISVEDANKYGRRGNRPANQQAIANTVYGGSWGKINLGNLKWGDGWDYRGKGIFQLTGLSNYSALTKYVKSIGIDVDYVKNPELLLNEPDSLIAALWFWKVKNIDKYADKDQVLAVSRIINLGNANSTSTPHGYDDRKAQTEKFKKIFK